MRAQLEKRMAQKEKTRKEELLKGLAKKAREEHAGLRSVPTGPIDDAEREREKLRQDRARWDNVYAGSLIVNLNMVIEV